VAAIHVPDRLSYYHSVDEAERGATASALKARTAWLQSDESPFGVHEAPPDAPGTGYLYAKQELLVTARDLPRLTKALEQLKVEAKPEHAEELGVVRLHLSPTPDSERRTVPELLAEIRKVDLGGGDREQVPLRVAPNHVVSGEPEYIGGPATAARRSPTKTSVKGRLGKDVHVAVLDTGYTRGVHPYMDDHISSTGTPELDAQPHDGHIDFEAGHATFVAGMILRHAPQAQIDAVEVLGPAGFGTEHDIAQAIVAHAGAHVINLSLGGYTEGDQPPVALDAALRKVRPGTAVVAAAGNNNSERLMWPAAFKRVIAVGALDRTGLQRAAFSNYGWWVDACALAEELVGPFPRFPADGDPQFDGWAIWSGTSFAAPKLAGEIAARLSTRHFGTARDAAASLINDPTRPHLPGLGTQLNL
jgi:subtilisin family serine protease